MDLEFALNRNVIIIIMLMFYIGSFQQDMYR